MRRNEGVIPRDIVGRVLDVAGDDTVLVGGQALAFWMIRYRIALKAFKPIRTLANTQAARKNAIRYGIHVADAIPAALVSPDSAFWERDWMVLHSLMSPPYAQCCEDQRDECRVSPQPK